MQRIYVTIRPLNREDSVLYFPPEAFGPFRVLHQIGAGTLGPVFRAYEPGRDRLVAVKVFRLDLTPEQTAALVVELEKLIAANITHPNIAAPIAAGLEHGTAYLAQEYVVGESLDVVLRERGTKPVNDLAALVESLGGAIDHAAKRGVSHGMLDARDIIIASDTARITGFGIAAALSKVGAELPARTLDAATDSDALRAIVGGLTGAAGAAGAIGAMGAMGAKPAPLAPTAPIAALAPFAPEDPEDPLDRFVDLGAPQDLEPPPALLHDADLQPQHSSNRNVAIVSVVLAFGLLAVLSVGFFLKSPTSAPVAEQEPAVDETVVDLPDKPAPVAPPKPRAPVAPTPSRPASGAVRRTQTGSMLVRSTPADADVLVNGKPSGKTPLALRGLALGSYTIRVARDGYATEERTLQLTARRPATSTTINLRPISARGAVADKPERTGPGELNVQSRPAGARVFVNDRLAGSTPIAIPGLPAGDATVRIEKDGYVPWTATVRVSAGEQTAVRASLEGK